MTPTERSALLQRTALVVSVVLLALVACSVLVFAADICLVAFLGVLFGVLLTRLSSLIPLRHSFALTGVVLLFLVAGSVVVALFGLRIQEEAQELGSHVTEGVQAVRDLLKNQEEASRLLKHIPWGGKLLESSSTHPSENPKPGESTSPSAQTLGFLATGVASLTRSTLGVVLNVVIILFLGLYFAIEPETYRAGAVRLLPQHLRSKANSLFGEMGDTLWQWMLGQFLTMAITGIGTGVAMWLLGVPLPMALGMLTGLLTFIPNIGPLAALVVASLVGLSQGLTTAGLVIAVFLMFQLVESYVLTPLVQYHQVAIPPALLLIVQILATAAAGLLGLMCAAPLLALAMLLIKRLYLPALEAEPSG